MAEPASEKGPNWFWRLCELWGITWPGHTAAAAAASTQAGAPVGPPPRCAACRNPATRDRHSGQWRCAHHPGAGVEDASAPPPASA